MNEGIMNKIKDRFNELDGYKDDFDDIKDYNEYIKNKKFVMDFFNILFEIPPMIGVTDDGQVRMEWHNVNKFKIAMLEFDANKNSIKGLVLKEKEG